MADSKIKKKSDIIVLFLVFFSILGYMPTSRPGDNYVWMACFILLVINTFLRRKQLTTTNSMTWYSIFIVYGAVSCIWAQYTNRYVHFFFMTYLVVLVSVLCITSYVDSVESAEQVLWILTLAGCAAALRYCCYTDISGILKSGYYMRGTFGGLIDNVTNYNNYTTPLCFVDVVTGYLLFYRKMKKAYVPFIFLTAILVFSGSRKTYIVVAVMAIIFSILQGNALQKTKALLSITAIIIVGWIFLNNVPFMAQIREKTYSLIMGMLFKDKAVLDNSSLVRLRMREGALDVWNDHLLFGVGWNNYRYLNPMSEATAHNGYYELLASLGVFGVLLYYPYLFFSVVQKGVMILKRRISDFDIVVFGIVMTSLLMDIGTVSVYNRGDMIIILVVMSLGYIVNGRCKKLVFRGK